MDGLSSGAVGFSLTGQVVRGQGVAKGFTELFWVRREFLLKLGLRLWPGTLNLRILDAENQALWEAVCAFPGIPLVPPNRDSCGAKTYPVVLNDQVRGAIVLPEIPEYPKDLVEVVSVGSLRAELRLADGDLVSLRVSG